MKLGILISIFGLLLFSASAAQAQLEGFTANPTTNSADFEARVAELSGTVNKSIDFESHPLGTLQSDFYAGIGVTLTANGDVNDVTNGAGPGQGNTSTGPLSSGEGAHAASNYLTDGPDVSSLTVTFDTPTSGAGLFTIDYFNPSGDNPLRIEAFDGPNGTGNSLGSFDSQAYNFQKNNLYFMGVVDPDARIRSVVFYDLSTNTGDVMGLDDIWFVSGVSPRTQMTPVPGMTRYAQIVLVLLLLAIASIALRRRRA